MVRTSILLVGYAHAAESGSLMQSAHSELGSAEGVTFRLNRLAELQMTTQRMEAEYKAMANAIINKEIDPATGRPYEAPRAVDFDVIQGQFDDLLWQLEQEKNTNQRLVNDANAKVAACNTARNTAYSTPGTGVDARLAAQQEWRQKHNTCRGKENTAIETRKDSCEKFVAEKICESQEGDYNHFLPADALMRTIENAAECKEDLADEVVVSTDCDVQQKKFELKFCQYDLKLTDTCNTLNSCYDHEIADRQLVVTGVGELEKNQKVVYNMIQKVKCYVDAMKNKFKTLQHSDIAHCEQMTLDAGVLNIDYPNAETKAPCDKSLLANGAPGDRSWALAEYNATLHHLHHGEEYAGHNSPIISKIENIIDCATRLAEIGGH